MHFLRRVSTSLPRVLAPWLSSAGLLPALVLVWLLVPAFASPARADSVTFSMSAEVTRDGATDFFWDFFWEGAGGPEFEGFGPTSPWIDNEIITARASAPILPTSMSFDDTRMLWTWSEVTMEVPDDGGIGAQAFLEQQIEASQAALVSVWSSQGFLFKAPEPDYSGLGMSPPINVKASNATYPFLIKIDYDLPVDYEGFTCIVLRMASTPHVEDSNPTTPSVCLLNGLNKGPRCYIVSNSLAPPIDQWGPAERSLNTECASGGNAGDVFFDERRYFWVEVVTGDVSLISDPGDHGIFGGLPPGSTTTFPTSTTLATQVCGDASGDGKLRSSDALVALKAAVGLGECEDCVCDVSGSVGVTASDALAILAAAVGQAVELACVPCS